MKNWEDMSSHERAEVTFRDIRKRQVKRELERLEGIKQADNFVFSQKEKSIKCKKNIRCKSYRWEVYQ